ncbi:hypothetical protein SAMN05421818_13113 [Myroides phaeus]|uniref:Uncharacterized protein n=1 Tax=Myroides phaeus TaxID=702745 RepID=A0A1G8GR66_9FLAO|nr:hypothetical protein SAMN05421818_13113 [Myroides phaeus]
MRGETFFVLKCIFAFSYNKFNTSEKEYYGKI